MPKEKTVRVQVVDDAVWAFETPRRGKFPEIPRRQTLRWIREQSFVFTAPPIAGKASEDTVRLPGEATQAYLFGLNRACLALCRACVESLSRKELKEDRI